MSKSRCGRRASSGDCAQFSARAVLAEERAVTARGAIRRRWYGFRTDPEATKRSVDWIRGYIENGARPSELGDVEISVTPPTPISKEVIRQYEDVGVHRLTPWLNAPTLDETLRYVDETGALLSG